MKFSQLLTQYREKCDLNKEDLARRLKISGSYIRGLELGKKKPPPLDRVEEIAVALSLSSEEKDLFIKAAANERLPEKERNIIADPQKTYTIRDTKIPVVSEAKANDESGFSIEQFQPYEYEYIDFSKCKAIMITSNSMAPIAYKGQKIIYSEDARINEGDLVFVKLKTGEQYFKKFFDHNKEHIITLQGVNMVETYKPKLVKKSDIEFMYKVVGVRF